MTTRKGQVAYRVQNLATLHALNFVQRKSTVDFDGWDNFKISKLLDNRDHIRDAVMSYLRRNQ